MNIQQMIDGDDEKIISGDEENGPAEIDLSNEDLSTSESNEDEAAAAAKARADAEARGKNRVPANKRIGQLTREKMEAIEYATRIQQELEQERQRNKELAERASKADKAAFTNYELAVTKSLADAKRSYQEAMASGDAEKIADATIELNKWSAEKTEVDRFKSTHRDEPEPERQRQPARDEPEQQRRQHELPDEARKWIEETAWFNPKSDEFDPMLHGVAVRYAQVIEAEYAETGRADEIGKSEQYFKDITDFVRNRYPDRFSDVVDLEKPASRTPAMSAGRPDTAPAARVNGNGGVGGSPSTKVSLSADEVDMVRRLMNEGVYKDKNGKKVSDMTEAKRQFALQKYKLERADALTRN